MEMGPPAPLYKKNPFLDPSPRSSQTPDQLDGCDAMARLGTRSKKYLYIVRTGVLLLSSHAHLSLWQL